MALKVHILNINFFLVQLAYKLYIGYHIVTGPKRKYSIARNFLKKAIIAIQYGS
uniref:Uncharacterized protein n=1 Tax=Arundo donax TaxID=35708 RepID=A0A0A9CT98_ARUDO